MIRITISLPVGLKAALHAQASAEGRTEADLIREALAEKLQMGKTARDMRFGLAASRTTTSSTAVDEILAATGFGQ